MSGILKSATFECEVITPIFSFGATEKPELRCASLKGLMRYWWRAIKATDDLVKLKEEENEIFGGTDEKEGKSKVLIRLFTHNIGIGYDFSNYLESNKDNKNDILYLFYSVAQQSIKQYIKIGYKFKVKFLSADINVLKHSIASFWGCVFLGGIGSRARRCGGNISITQLPEYEGISEDEKQKLPEFVSIVKSADEVADWLKNNFQKCQAIICNGKPQSFCYKYSNLSIARIIVSKNPEDSPCDALGKLGKVYKNFRSENKDNIQVRCFGLPVVKGKGKSKSEVTSNFYKRRSSPLIFKVLRFNNKYYWMVLRLAGEFLPKGNVLCSDGRTEKPHYSIIDEFWQQLKKQGVEKIISTPKYLDDIVSKLKSYGVNYIVLFGSKARGDFSEKSDTDIAIKGGNPADLVANVDIVNLDKINSNFKKRIENEGIKL